MKIECCGCGKKFFVADYQEAAFCPDCHYFLEFPPADELPARRKSGHRGACINPKCTYYGWMTKEPSSGGWILAFFAGIIPATLILFLSDGKIFAVGDMVIAFFLPLLIWAARHHRRPYICPVCRTRH